MHYSHRFTVNADFRNIVFISCCFLKNFFMLLKSSDGSAEPPEVFPGARSWLPAAYSSAGPGAGLAAAGYLSAVSASLDAG